MAGGTTHLVQAGASILGSGKKSKRSINLSHSSGGINLDGSARSQSEGLALSSLTQRYDQESVAGNTHKISSVGASSSSSTAGATILTSPASGPLSLTTSSVAGGSTSSVKNCNSGTSTSSLSSEWQEFWDEEVEASYYYNCITGEALWVRPEGL